MLDLVQGSLDVVRDVAQDGRLLLVASLQEEVHVAHSGVDGSHQEAVGVVEGGGSDEELEGGGVPEAVVDLDLL